jgi:hypothetical protein
MKQVVWTSSGTGATDTIGLTGWLLAHRLERFVEMSQLIAMAMAYFVAWRAVSSGGRPLPWMGFALLVFSMTSLWPVFYIYYDVLFVFISAALAETLNERLRLKPWALSLAATVVLVAIMVSLKAVQNPEYIRESAVDRRAFGFAPAALLLPRRSVSAAEIVIACKPFQPSKPDDMVTAYLNGRPLWTARLHSGTQEIRFVAPRSAWRLGHNRLDLKVPRDDAQSLPLVITRVAVVPRRF